MRRHLVLLPLVLVLAGPAVADAQERRVVKDPAGGPSWTAALRASGSRDCAVVRRGTAAKGLYCARLSGGRIFSYVERHETSSDPRQSRTILVVVFARSVVRARLATRDGVLSYRRGRGPRVLLAVLAGDVEKGRLTARVRVGRATKTVTGGPVRTIVVDDPSGGAAWRLAPDTDRPRSDRACVAWERVKPRFGEPAGTRSAGARRCGDEDATLLAYAERVEGRLVVTGLTDGDVRSVALRDAAGSRPVRRDAASGELLAVLPGETDPDGVTLVATLRDGTTVSRGVTLVD